MARLIDSSILKFLLVGVGNTLLSMALMFLLEDLGYWPSTAIAYVAVCYVLAYGVAQPVGGLILGRTSLPTVWRDRLTKLGGMALYTGFNYFGQRFFAFRRR